MTHKLNSKSVIDNFYYSFKRMFKNNNIGINLKLNKWSVT